MHGGQYMHDPARTYAALMNTRAYLQMYAYSPYALALDKREAPCSCHSYDVVALSLTGAIARATRSRVPDFMECRVVIAHANQIGGALDARAKTKDEAMKLVGTAMQIVAIARLEPEEDERLIADAREFAARMAAESESGSLLHMIFARNA